MKIAVTCGRNASKCHSELCATFNIKELWGAYRHSKVEDCQQPTCNTVDSLCLFKQTCQCA
jgi:hypothetical protein